MMSDRSEQAMTELVEQVAAALVEGWHEMNKFQQYQIKDTILPVLATCIDVLDAEPHKAKRGDEVEAWIKRTRDGYDPPREDLLTYKRDEPEWVTLDELLDDYRLHADTATPLSEVAHEGPTDPFAGDEDDRPCLICMGAGCRGGCI